MYNAQLPSRAELPSSGQLLRSTIIAIISAVVILVAIVLPSEYGLDPTGIGKKLGLTQMGEIKLQLAAEAEADAKAQVSGEVSTASPIDTAKPPLRCSQIQLRPSWLG